MATLTQLEYLIAVDLHRHFGKAAKACHISQPTLSMQLHKLEEEYGITFFDRSKKPILATREGATLIEQAKAVLREAKKLDHLVRNQDKVTGEFKLALIPTIAPYLLPRFLGYFASAYPEVNLQVQEMTTQNIVKALENDEIDAGILATPLKGESLIEIPLYYEPFFLLISNEHPLAKVQTVNEEKLNAKEVWLLSEGHCLRNQVVRICSGKGKSGLFPNVQLESGSIETLIHLVEQGYGYTLLPQLAALSRKPAKNTVLRPFSKPAPSREVSIVYRRSQFKQAIIDAMEKVIRGHLPADLPQKRPASIEVVQI